MTEEELSDTNSQLESFSSQIHWNPDYIKAREQNEREYHETNQRFIDIEEASSHRFYDRSRKKKKKGGKSSIDAAHDKRSEFCVHKREGIDWLGARMYTTAAYRVHLAGLSREVKNPAFQFKRRFRSALRAKAIVCLVLYITLERH